MFADVLIQRIERHFTQRHKDQFNRSRESVQHTHRDERRCGAIETVDDHIECESNANKAVVGRARILQKRDKRREREYILKLGLLSDSPMFFCIKFLSPFPLLHLSCSLPPILPFDERTDRHSTTGHRLRWSIGNRSPREGHCTRCSRTHIWRRKG